MGKKTKQFFLITGFIFLIIAIAFLGMLFGLTLLIKQKTPESLAIQNSLLIIITTSLIFGYMNLLQYGNEKELEQIKEKVTKEK